MTTVSGKPLRVARRDFERSYILRALRRADWSIGRAAMALGVSRPNLYRKARQLQLSLKRPDGGPTP